LPRDAWHLVQTIRNQSVVGGTLCAAVFMRALLDERALRHAWWHTALVFVSPFLMYGIARAVAFSLVKQLMNG
jgi:hypothetical protein